MDLSKKISEGSAKIGIMGLGYVGLPLAVEFGNAGFKVTGIDVDRSKVVKINKGVSYIGDVGSKELKALVRKGLVKATTDFSVLKNIDAVIICVPTPLRKTRDPDMSYIIASAEKIAKYQHKGQLIVLESTTYTGTCEEIILPILAEGGYEAGKDFFMAFSPERVDPGNKEYGTKDIPKVIGGLTKKCLKMAQALYGRVIVKIVPVSSIRVAEMVKLLENTFRAVNIGLVNEIAMMCDRMDIDVWEVIKGAETKPFGFTPFYPGPGIGGHCLPIDPLYLSWKAKSFDFEARFIELASQINSYMPYHIVNKLIEGLNKRGKCLKKSSILILGVAYKKNVGDTRESPAIDILRKIKEAGARVNYCDPFVPEIRLEKGPVKGKKVSRRLLENADCVLILTNHDCFDYKLVVKHSKFIFDTRNTIKNSNNKILKL
ncbi:MAG: nucleotide sugar dehydrogenase [Candidatus Aureabacteria bacterium]|nr:nucleotide sugar dehydrogenase [Candidatus Auribacterota bacterium]